MAQRILVAAACLLLGFGCASPVGGPQQQVTGVDPRDVDLTREILDLDKEINALEVWLSDYPAEFESKRERQTVINRWRGATERASVLLNVDLRNPELFARVGALYRQGHNLDVPEAASASFNSLSQCLQLAPDHVECHFNLARLLLASAPNFAGRAEQHLQRILILVEPDSRPDVEAALARAYFIQGRRSAALRQIDHYLSLRPDDREARRFRNALLIEVQSGR